jgi:hypothetical protein
MFLSHDSAEEVTGEELIANADRTENTASNSSMLACVFVEVGCLYRSGNVFTAPLPSTWDTQTRRQPDDLI